MYEMIEKFKTDEWVLYCPFPENESLKTYTHRAVILEVLEKRDIYDYRIYIDDHKYYGKDRIIRVKKTNLFPINKR